MFVATWQFRIIFFQINFKECVPFQVLLYRRFNHGFFKWMGQKVPRCFREDFITEVLSVYTVNLIHTWGVLPLKRLTCQHFQLKIDQPCVICLEKVRKVSNNQYKIHWVYSNVDSYRSLSFVYFFPTLQSQKIISNPTNEPKLTLWRSNPTYLVQLTQPTKAKGLFPQQSLTKTSLPAPGHLFLCITKNIYK